ncbi:MAG: hypothetical protein HQ557_13525 [Bacteroidetes bacterium]|nr:hypothetical protein [Bacteroidota bacterium]
MKAKDRMMLALNLEIPDRLPATIHQWQPYHLNKYMKGMTDVEAFSSVGLDAAITWYSVQNESGADWKISEEHREGSGDYRVRHFSVKTPGGELTFAHGENPMTTWVVEPLIKRDEDINLINKYRPIPTFDRQGFLAKYDELGDGGIMRTFIWGYQGGCWQDACELFGLENLILATFDKPEWVHELLQTLLKQKIAYIDNNLCRLPVDLVETGGGASSNTVISPAIHEEFCLPYDRMLHDALKSHGFKVVYHTCGGMSRILDQIAQNGADASETLSPPGVGGDLSVESLAQIKKGFGSKLALIGGIDQINVLSASDEVIKCDVQEKFECLGQGGGFIMSACDHFFDLPVDRLECYARKAIRCEY